MAIGMSATLGGFVLPARAESTEELKQLKEELQKQKAALDAERKALEEQRRRLDEAIERLETLEAAKEAPPPVASSVPAAEAQPKPRSSLQIYGFAQVDGIYDFNRVADDWNATLRPSRIPIVCPGDSGCGNDGETIFSAKQTRFGTRGFIPTDYGDIRTQFEFDLFATGDDAGEANLRLRHAWGSLGPVLGGQTNSLFMDGEVFPNTIDYWGPAGMIYLRTPQFRYTPVSNDEGLNLAVALESAGTAIDEGKIDEVDPNFVVDSRNQYPDGTVQARYTGDWGHVQGSAILRGVGFEVAANPGADPSGTKLGWGVSGSGGIHTFGRDRILLQLSYGRAIANYFNDGGTDLAPDANLNDATTVPSLGWMTYYDRYWNDQWSSSIGFSEHRQDNTGGQSGTSFKTGQYFSVNTLWSPVTDFMTGLEFLWGRRENNDNEDASDTRVQVSLKYNFDGTIGGDQ
jgi:hypothetical protein